MVLWVAFWRLCSVFQLDPGIYHVYLLDEGAPICVIESDGDALSVLLKVAPQGTRLLYYQWVRLSLSQR